ncbi:MAG: peptide chain release factor H [Crocinitomicaceae bacterium]
MKQKILQISAGNGPAECAWVVAQLLKTILIATKNLNIKVIEVDREKGTENATLNSATLFLEGAEVGEFCSKWNGTIQWIGQSPYRRYHKRKNWFVDVSTFESEGTTNFKQKDVKFETFRSSGAGGQNVNKVETAVRATHTPTNVSVVCRSTPSQLINKKIAIEKLKIELEKRRSEQAAELMSSQWMAHKSIQRGNPIRVYEGKKFDRKK